MATQPETVPVKLLEKWNEHVKMLCSTGDSKSDELRESLVFLVSGYRSYSQVFSDAVTLERAAASACDNAKQYVEGCLCAGVLLNMSTLVSLMHLLLHNLSVRITNDPTARQSYDTACQHVQRFTRIVVDVALRNADSSKRPDFRELDGLSIGADTRASAWKIVSDYMCTGSTIASFTCHLPYGKEGAAAYRYMQELRFYAKGYTGPTNHWPQILHELLSAPSDKKRVADLVLGQVPKETPCFKTLDKEEREVYLRHAAEGISQHDVWNVLKRDELIDQSKNQTGTSRREGGRARGGGMRFDDDGGGDDIAGRWEAVRDPKYTVFKFKIDPNAARSTRAPARGMANLMGLGGGGIMGMGGLNDDDDMFDDMGGFGGGGRMRTAGSYHLELILPETKLTGKVLPVPQQGGGRMVSHALLADFYCELPTEGRLLLFHMRTRNYMHRERSPRLSVYVREYRGGPMPYDIVGQPAYSLQKDEVADERVVVFAARAMREVLQHPPEARLKEKLQKTLKDLDGLQDELQTRIARIGVRRCHPATVLSVLETMEPKAKIFGETGWIVTQAENAPCINHIAVLGLALEANHLLNRYPVAVAQALEAVAKGETGKVKDPLAVLQSLNKVSCHDFDGTWTWHNGLGHKTHPDGFTIHGHHVRFNTPELHPCTLREIRYEEDGLRFIMLQERPVANEHGFEEESTREVQYTVELQRTASGTYVGKWMRDQSHKWIPSRFELTGPPAVRPICEWGDQANKGTFPQLAERISGWGCEGLHKEIETTTNDACSTIRTIFPNLQVGTDDPFYGPILRLWEACCKQVVKKTSTEKLLPVLDKWVLATSHGRSLADLRDLRMHAAKILLKAYSSQRPVRWNSVPVSLTKLRALKGHYSILGTFIDSVARESKLLQNNLDTRKVSARAFGLMQNYRPIYADNKVVFPSNLDPTSFRVPRKELETTLHLCRELMEHWGVSEDARRMRDIEQKIRESDLVDLCDLESTVEEGKRTLGPAWDIQDAVLSPLLRAHFLASAVEGKTTTLSDMPRIFDQLKKNLSKFTLDTPIGIATARMDPTDGHLQGERKRQEVNLLLELGVKQDVAESLVDGALPLRYMINGLESFRTLADDKKCPRDLRLQPHFFNEKEKLLLLDADMDTTKLRDAADRAQAIREVSGGCKPEALEIISTMLKCEKIVEFTREHPQAQDEGLANVLTNARDLQHASFQTFLNCVSYINPFVAASMVHHNSFAERTKELEEERAEAGLKGKPTVDDVVKSASLRAPINNRTSLDTRTPDGFWDMLNKHFANDVVVRQIQANLERINTADQVDGLEKMIKEQNGATDRLISHCRAAAGMPPAETDDVEADAMDVDQEPALVVIDLPPTGTPSLKCEFGGVMKSGPEYQDIVYRATLQWNLDDALDVFRMQAREVLRVFNTVCVLFGEGHIEFRSRKITFRHNEGGKVNLMLRSLVGQWAAVSAGQVSVFHEACEQHPSLACLTPAELIRMAELLRGVSSSGDLTQEEAHRMVLPWRDTRTRPLRRGQQVTVTTSAVLEATLQEMSPQLTACLAVRLPQRNPLPGKGPNLLGTRAPAGTRFNFGASTLWGVFSRCRAEPPPDTLSDECRLSRSNADTRRVHGTGGAIPQRAA
eukprot:TRINITY_DN306_c0_g1_i14.p1 TRINITY_DN306_c0_g1~~TRINITY_DN306_c0_g1_i14.p1  ORF type:complete len:1630 (+),score=746.19 TRINITY_DN306_c0_g1_i14:269-5158(+)